MPPYPYSQPASLEYATPAPLNTLHILNMLDATGEQVLRAAEAIWLARSFGVVAEEIDRRRAPSASGDRLFLVTVQGAAGMEHAAHIWPPEVIVAHQVGRRWVVRINRRNPSQLACTCPLGKRPGGLGGQSGQSDTCGHIGAVLLLLGRG